jgi:hypothetical protein
MSYRIHGKYSIFQQDQGDDESTGDARQWAVGRMEIPPNEE